MLGADRKSTHLVPAWQDINLLEAVNKAMEPLAELTDIMSGNKYATVEFETMLGPGAYAGGAVAPPQIGQCTLHVKYTQKKRKKSPPFYANINTKVKTFDLWKPIALI